jgi:hypothetical protein
VDEIRLASALETYITPALAAEVSADFCKLRQDCATGTLGRATPGKFVEAFVQCLQYISAGQFDEKPDVDIYLSRKVESETNLPEGLRICGARVARAIYTLRNKRNIAHKNPVDPNRFDLAFAHHGAAWIMAELLRNASGITMHEAGVLIELVQTPVGSLVEEIDGVRLIHAETSIRGELLILFHSYFPERVQVADILATFRTRSSASVRNRLSELRTAKLTHGDSKVGYRLTQTGFAAAVAEIQQVTSPA